MNTGKYFELDKESRDIDAKMLVFNYLRYKNKNKDNNSERMQPDYPIYVVITKDGVSFYIHTCYHDENNEVKHYSGCILFLPISLDEDFHNELSTKLNVGYNSYVDVYCEKLDMDEKVTNGIGFDIKCFNNYKEKKTDDNKIPIHIGQLILDFMFDMEHSSVFKHSVLYNNIYSSFHSHSLFDAIITKAEYSFYRDYCSKDVQDTSVQDIYAYDLYSRIERKWVEIITNNKSEYLFHESPWFDDVVNEMNCVYECEDSCLDLYDKIKHKEKCDKTKNRVLVTSEISRDWYMSKYRLDGVFRIRYGEKNYKQALWGGFYIPIVLIALIFIAPITIYFPFIKLQLIIPIIIIATIYYFIPKILVKRSLFRGKTFLNIIMPRLFAGICAGWMTIGLSSILRYGYINYIVPSVISILLVTFFFTAYSIHKVLPFEKQYRIGLISLLIISISMIYSIISGYCLFKIYEGGAEESFNPLYCVCDAKTLLLFSSLSMFVGVFINLLFHNKSISSYE